MKKNNTLEGLKKDFELRSERSLDKATLLKREIECFEYIFSYENDIVGFYNTYARPTTSDSFSIKFSEYSRLFSDVEVYVMKKAYDYFIVQGAPISEAVVWYVELSGSGNTEVKRRSDLPDTAISYFVKVRMYYDYLCWLKSINSVERKYAEKYYAWYHRIKIAIGKADPFPPGAKQEIINYGKEKYGTREGFYQAFITFKPEKQIAFVNSFTAKERKKWKSTIIEISGNDVDVIRYLENFPN